MALARRTHDEITAGFDTVFEDAASVDPGDPSGSSCSSFKELLAMSYANLSAKVDILESARDILEAVGKDIGCSSFPSKKDVLDFNEYIQRNVDDIGAKMPAVKEKMAECGFSVPVAGAVDINMTAGSPKRSRNFA